MTMLKTIEADWYDIQFTLIFQVPPVYDRGSLYDQGPSERGCCKPQSLAHPQIP